ncbi:ribonuclease R [Nitzschia inconspicua]|uniref:Ribonuclease R n=1 Tax=Nitzschia inconspicua TaxID=303405 RepID=A0A9K3Q0L5_9STRA|nr:ribonuclease R [Nitzschia inconspicua]
MDGRGVSVNGERKPGHGRNNSGRGRGRGRGNSGGRKGPPRDRESGRQQQSERGEDASGRPDKKKNVPVASKSKDGSNETNNYHNNRNTINANNRVKNRDNNKTIYPKYWSLDDCLTRYNAQDPNLIRGTLRVLPAKNGAAFCTCDRGSQVKDVMLDGPIERNRALDGDTVYVELLPEEENSNEAKQEEANAGKSSSTQSPNSHQNGVSSDENEGDKGGDDVNEEWWQDDPDQVRLWDPVVPLRRSKNIPKESSIQTDDGAKQRHGRVVYIVFPKLFTSEIGSSEQTNAKPTRRIVGTLKRLQSGTTLLTPTNKSMEQFRLSKSAAEKFKDSPEGSIFQAKYVYGSWQEDFKWPPCVDVQEFGHSGNIEDETAALLIENGVDHGEFPANVLEQSLHVVASGQYANGSESGWKPTSDMYKGRRDYRSQRIFTIDPTTAKDLDDALHITDLGNGQVEIGVHIADVSHFVQPDSQIDLEAQRRCTTVYLVDRVIPMLPKALCEVACSLNPNVERLAFSCVWRMNRDGTMVKGHKAWYGRSVIKSCAKLDYATAQNIIERKVAIGENQLDDTLWPPDRRPTDGHTVDQVAADVRLMNEIAQARRQLRFRNGAIALNAVKLTFKLDSDGETPMMCEPYPIRDSNKLIEEYMLLANYLVAQRLITHAGGLALLRQHEPPLGDGLEKAAALAMEALGFKIDITSSESLQRSLNRLGRECQDEIILKCVTEVLKTPMKPANYIAAGGTEEHMWSHFALHIPYYTHFTSPIRRYADVIVHRLLQATLDGREAVEEFSMDQKRIASICENCNEKKDGSRKAQERSDVVFLALYLRRSPMKHVLGVVLSIGTKAFTAFLPSLGISAMLFLEEHSDWIDYEAYNAPNIGNRIKLKRTKKHKGSQWKDMLIKNFAKISVCCKCSEQPPLCVKLELEGPWSQG